MEVVNSSSLSRPVRTVSNMVGTPDTTKQSTWNSSTKVNKNATYHLVSSAIVEKIPNALTMRNQIPKAYLPFDLYCNLIPNTDTNSPYFQQVPRTGAFEVSFKGLVSFVKIFQTPHAFDFLLFFYS